MGFDLSTLNDGRKKQEDGVEVEIIHPATKQPTGIVITVACYESERVMAEARRLGNAKRQKMAKGRVSDPVEADEERIISLAVAATVSWSGIEENGEPLACKPDIVARVYRQFPFILDQVQEAGSDRALFFAN